VLGRRYDAVGLVLVGLLAAWILLTGLAADSDPLPMLGMLVMAVLAYVAGRATASVESGAMVVGVIVVIVGVIALPETLHGPPRSTPLDYENADAAWLAQGTAALLVLALSTRRQATRRWAWGGAVFLVAVAAGLASLTGAGLAAMVLLVGLLAHRLHPGPLAAVGFAAVLAVAGFSSLLGAAWTADTGSGSIAQQALSERRAALWHDALVLITQHPVLGLGPGGFSTASPTAIEFPYTSETHSVYLQQAAETGLPGLLLLLGLLFWAYIGLARSGVEHPLAVVGIAGLTAFAIHAAVDYVAHYAVIVATAAYLVGLLSRPSPVRSGVGGRGTPRS
jgi:putative inorganic carbon (hco3(-)) transporter